MVGGCAWHQLPPRMFAGIPPGAVAPCRPFRRGGAGPLAHPCAVCAAHQIVPPRTFILRAHRAISSCPAGHTRAAAGALVASSPPAHQLAPAAGHGAPAEPLGGPHARCTRCHREGPRSSVPVRRISTARRPAASGAAAATHARESRGEGRK